MIMVISLELKHVILDPADRADLSARVHNWNKWRVLQIRR